RKYHVAHFHLDPTHVGLPNNRPRHYTVAFRRGVLQQRLNDSAMRGTAFSSPTSMHIPHHDVAEGTPKYDHIKFRQESLEKPPIIYNEQSLQPKGERKTPQPPSLPCVSSILDADLSPHATTSASTNPSKQKLLQIPEKIRTSSSSWCFDIVTPHHHCTSCFTHSYGKFIRGTGSILYTGPLLLGESSTSANDTNLDRQKEWCNSAAATAAGGDGGSNDTNDKKDGAAANVPSIDRFQLVPAEERTFDAAWSKDLDWDRDMRYFSGTEIARLMGFPVAELPAAVCDDSCLGKGLDGTTAATAKATAATPFRKFSFPPECTMKQQWKLLGNSLNVRVAACVAEMGIRSVLNSLEGGDDDDDGDAIR
ncbi:hypothetical protein ACHAXR_004370, partial [Thalassiosira sp. AJA248-18]